MWTVVKWNPGQTMSVVDESCLYVFMTANHSHASSSTPIDFEPACLNCDESSCGLDFWLFDHSSIMKMDYKADNKKNVHNFNQHSSLFDLACKKSHVNSRLSNLMHPRLTRAVIRDN